VWLRHHSWYVNPYHPSEFQNVLTSEQDIIVSGLTRATKRLFRSRYTWQLLELVQLKEASDGGREVIEPIIDTPIHQKTPTL
jgi:hypothetical protein